MHTGTRKRPTGSFLVPELACWFALIAHWHMSHKEAVLLSGETYFQQENIHHLRSHYFGTRCSWQGQADLTDRHMAVASSDRGRYSDTHLQLPCITLACTACNQAPMRTSDARLCAHELLKRARTPATHSDNLPTWYMSGCVNLGSSISLCP